MIESRTDAEKNTDYDFSDEVLFTKELYPWVGGSNIGSYFISTTSSHYDWAMKKMKAHKKNLGVK